LALRVVSSRVRVMSQDGVQTRPAPDSVSSWRLLRTICVATVLLWSPSAQAGCGFWKNLACFTPIGACTMTAGFGGRDPILRCVAAGASWCLECLEGTGLDPHDANGPASGAGVVCDSNGCRPGKTGGALTVPPVAATPGTWPRSAVALPNGGVPSVIRDGNKTIAFFRGTNRRLWMMTRTDAAWGDPVDLGGISLASDPSAVIDSAGKYRVFYAGSNGHLWLSSWDGGPWWSAPADLGGVKINSAPSAVALAPETYRVFYKGPNNHLWLSSKDPGPWWSAPADLGGIELGSAPSAVTVKGEPNHIGVFYVGRNGHLTMSVWDGGPWWSQPIDLGGGQVRGNPSAVSSVDHEIDVFYVNGSFELSQSQWIGGPWWSAVYARGVAARGGVAAMSNREVFIRDVQGRLYFVSAP